jgi:L-rhamnose mutarotase
MYISQTRPPGTKLQNRAVDGRIVGHTDSPKVYQVYISSKHTVTITRQITFLPTESGKVTMEFSEQLEDTIPPPEPRKSGRKTHPPVRYDEEYSNSTINAISCHVRLRDEPHTWRQAITRPDARKWIEAMNEEMTALEGSGTYILVKNRGQKTVGCKRVFKIKSNADRTVERYKASVEKGYSLQPGLDFNETFAPAARYESLQLLIATSNSKDYSIYQMDVKSAFLYGVLIYATS